MSGLSSDGVRLKKARLVDSEGELYARPAGLGYVFGALVILTALEAINGVFGVGGPSSLYQTWCHDLVLAGAAVLILARAAYEPETRTAWLAFGLATMFWSVGNISWSAAYSGQAHPPYPTFADGLWLLWYPLMAVGITLLIKVHLPRFELHRWMDGLAVTLLVLAGGFAVIIQPVADHTSQGTLATVVDFSYPVLDVLLMGAILGVYGLLGWRPDRMWILIGLGVLATTAADAAFAIQEARGVTDGGRYDFIWPLGALLIAAAAWVTVPTGARQHRDVAVTGLRAVALLLVAQALAAGIQVYALFGTVGKSERVVTLAVLVVTSVQIILNRPRPAAAAATSSAPAEASPAAASAGDRGAQPDPAVGPPKGSDPNLSGI